MNLKIFKKSKKGLKNWAILLGSLFFIVLLPSIGVCEDVTLTMPIEDAKRMVVELEKIDLYVKQITLLEKTNEQLIEQTALLQRQIDLLKEQLKIQQDQLAIANKELDNQKKLYDTKVETYEKEKPSIFQKLFIGLGSGGIGVLIGILLL